MSIFIHPALYKVEIKDGVATEPVETIGNTGVEPAKDGGWIIRGWARGKKEFLKEAKEYLENTK